MLAEYGTSFVLGLLTPLTAACVLPLYPAFLAYLSRQFDGGESRHTYALFGTIVVLGVLSFMTLVGIVFSTVLQKSLTSVIEAVSPIAFGLLGLTSIALLLDLDFQKYLPKYDGPESENPLVNAFGFGFFFGAIILPCNPGFIAAFFARAFLFETPISSILNFGLFGLGIGFPLLAFSIASSRWNQKIISIIKTYDSWINRGTGLAMLIVSVYYLIWVFNILGIK